MDVAGWGASDLEPAQSAAPIPFILPSLLLACSPLDVGAEQKDGYLQMSKPKKKKKSVSSPKCKRGCWCEIITKGQRTAWGKQHHYYIILSAFLFPLQGLQKRNRALWPLAWPTLLQYWDLLESLVGSFHSWFVAVFSRCFILTLNSQQ